jgi:hypothetical protein
MTAVRTLYQRHVWVIATRCSLPGSGLIGLGWFGWPTEAQPHLMSCHVAAFETRKAATEHMRRVGVRNTYPKARVERATLSIQQAVS